MRTTMKKTVVSALVAAVVSVTALGDLIVKDGDTLAFLGDSITQGGQSKPDGYVNLVLRSLALEGTRARRASCWV